MSYRYYCKPVTFLFLRTYLSGGNAFERHDTPSYDPTRTGTFLTNTVSPKRAWDPAWVLGAGSVKATARKIRPRLIADQSTMFVPGTYGEYQVPVRYTPGTVGSTTTVVRVSNGNWRRVGGKLDSRDTNQGRPDVVAEPY